LSLIIGFSSWFDDWFDNLLGNFGCAVGFAACKSIYNFQILQIKIKIKKKKSEYLLRLQNVDVFA
jgi:hypothetical protein